MIELKLMYVDMCYIPTPTVSFSIPFKFNRSGYRSMKQIITTSGQNNLSSLCLQDTNLPLHRDSQIKG